MFISNMIGDVRIKIDGNKLFIGDVRIKIDGNKLFILDYKGLSWYAIRGIKEEYEDDLKPYLKRLYKSAGDSFETIVNNGYLCKIKYKYFKERKDPEVVNIHEMFGIKCN